LRERGDSVVGAHEAVAALEDLLGSIPSGEDFAPTRQTLREDINLRKKELAKIADMIEAHKPSKDIEVRALEVSRSVRGMVDKIQDRFRSLSADAKAEARRDRPRAKGLAAGHRQAP